MKQRPTLVMLALLRNLTEILPIIRLYLEKRVHESTFLMLNASQKMEREMHGDIVAAVRDNAPDSYLNALHRQLQFQQSITADFKRQLETEISTH